MIPFAKAQFVNGLMNQYHLQIYPFLPLARSPP